MRQIADGLKQIADHYGLDNQLEKLQEELKELDEAVSEYQLDRKKLTHLLEEIADVENMVDQIKYLVRKTELVTVNVIVESCREEKIERQLERIEKEKRVND